MQISFQIQQLIPHPIDATRYNFRNVERIKNEEDKKKKKSNKIDINNRIDDLFKIHIIYGVFPINDSNIDHKLSEREQNSHKRQRSTGMHIVNTPKNNNNNK